MSTHTRKFYIDLLVAWLYVPVIALIVFVCGVSMAVRLVVFILASALVVRTMWPSDSHASPHVTDTSGPF